MMRLHIIIYMCLLSIAAQAQEPGEQLLVFRNTGVVDLLYTDEVDSILTTDDSQVFYAKDTVLVVPFAELDSVAVGSRNEMTFRDGVKELDKTEDLQWIISFDGQSIFYRLDTPSNILPSVGMKLFYGLEHNPTKNTIFPYGLCAKVTAVTKRANDICVAIEDVEIDEIFSRLFYAGPILSEQPVNATRLRAQRERDVYSVLEAAMPIELGDMGNLTLRGQVTVRGKLVTDISWKKKYYHADLNTDYEIGFDMDLHSEDSGSEEYDDYGEEKLIGSIYKVIDVYGALGSYIDAQADLSFEMNMHRTYHRKLLWTRIDKNDSFEFRDTNPNEPYTDSLKASVTLDGKLSFGPALRIDFAIVGLRLGARAKVKIGPEFEGHINATMLSNGRNFNPQLYASAELGVSGRVKFEGYTINRHYWILGIVDEHRFWDHSWSFGRRTWELFPQYQHTHAVVGNGSSGGSLNTNVSAATALPEPPIVDLETGFEIVDPQGEVVDSVFVGTILSEPEDTTVAQTFDTEIPLPPTIHRDQLEGYTLRPVFHYAGYTVSAAPVGIKKDVLLQRFTSTQSNGAMTFISSGPFLASAADDSIHYQLGAWLPVPLKHNVYKKASGSGLVESKPILDAQAEQLIGTWQGSVGEEPLTLTLHDDGTGMYNGMSVTYQLNYPQSGEMLLTFENNTNVIYRIFSVTEQKLMIADKREPQVTITLMRVI